MNLAQAEALAAAYVTCDIPARAFSLPGAYGYGVLVRPEGREAYVLKGPLEPALLAFGALMAAGEALYGRLRPAITARIAALEERRDDGRPGAEIPGLPAADDPAAVSDEDRRAVIRAALGGQADDDPFRD